MVREQEYAPQAQVVEYLRADAVVPVFAVAGLDAGLVLRQALLAHELVRAKLVDEVEVVVALSQVQDDAATRRRDALKGGVELKARVVYERAEHVAGRSEEHTSELQSRQYLVCRLLLGKKKK